MRRLAASSISSGDRCAAPVTIIKEGTTKKCYLSPEYNLLPITWTVQPTRLQPHLQPQKFVRQRNQHLGIGIWITEAIGFDTYKMLGYLFGSRARGDQVVHATDVSVVLVLSLWLVLHAPWIPVA